MKRKTVRPGAIVLIIFLLGSSTLGALGGNSGNAATSGRGKPAAAVPAAQEGQLPGIIEAMPLQPLSEGEIAGILLMREEEKLARDMYAALYETWRIPVFANISGSEQTHMDWMELIIQRYNLDDPASSGSAPGNYESDELQQVYDQLLEKGLASLKGALEVGATVEDLDIADLERLIAESDNDDLRVVYQNLNKGSRNHLRSFYSQLQRQGANYTPRYISDKLFRAIIGSRNERGAISDPRYSFL